MSNLFLRAVVGPFALSLACALGSGCAIQQQDEESEEASADSADAISDVAQSVVERQSIGNCWVYAHASWLESISQKATGVAYDSSQSYVTYWHWFEQIANGEIDGEKEISTGGWFRTANYLVKTYGVAPEASFVPADANNEMSSTQSSALAKMNQELSTGRLATTTARHNKKLVRQVLDEAFGLSPAVRAQLDKVFGKTVVRNLTTRSKSTGKLLASTSGTFVVRASAFPVAYTKWDATKKIGVPVKTSLEAAGNEWTEVSYSSWNRRDTQIRVQRALHDAQPVPLSWFVDFNALSNSGPLQGSFNMTTLGEAGGPGHQGGHMTVFEDYEIKLANGEVLKAGVTLDPKNPADKAKLDAALDPKAEIKFFRIKNSWGSSRLDRGFVPGMGGYHDLYMDYLDGPVTQCADDSDAKPVSERGCNTKTAGLRAVYLPPGY
ncbi:MAG: hypothetical protein ABI175_29725 [Polyangiales bacterium]